MITKAQKSGEGLFSINTAVHASDRGNWGRIMASGKDTSTVFFRNERTGLTRAKELKNSLLRPLDEAARETPTNILPPELMTTGEHKALMAEQIRSRAGKGLPLDPADLEDLPAGEAYATLQEWYNYKTHWEPDAIAHGVTREGLESMLHGKTHEQLKASAVTQGIVDELPDSISKTTRDLLEATADENALAAKMAATQGIPVAGEVTMGHLIASAPTEKVFKELGELVASQSSPVTKLTNFFKPLSPKTLETGIYNQSAMGDFFKYMDDIIESTGNVGTMHNFIKEVVTQGQAGEGYLSLSKLWRDKDVNLTKRGLRTFIENNPDRIPGLNLEQLRATLPPGEYLDALDEVAKTLQVPKKVERVLKAYVSTIKPGDDWVGGFASKMTNMWKGGVTTPWPAFHFRNLGSGHFVNVVEDQLNWKVWNHARRAVNGKEQLEYIDEIVRSGMLSDSRVIDTLSGEAGKRAASLMPVDPVTGRGKGVLSFFGESLTEGKASWRPWESSGGLGPALKGGGTRQSYAHALGERGYALVEYYNRVVPYITLRRRGLSPSQALHRVKASQFDYGALSAFEKRAMKPLVPFYGWLRKNIPFTLSTLMGEPGGRYAQTLRGVGAAQREAGGHAPGFLKETGAIRTGGEDKTAHFIKSLGLPFYDLNNIVAEDNGLPGIRTAQRMAANLNPLISVPMQELGETQWFSGRKFDQLHGVTEVPWMDRTIYASPAGRGVSTAEMLLHPDKPLEMKAIDALTGVKFGTYDLEKLQLYELQDAMKARIGKHPKATKYTSITIPKKDRPGLDKETLLDLERAKLITRAIREINASRNKDNLKP
jgi:hypothetical protein